jgi:hypothetical protein
MRPGSVPAFEGDGHIDAHRRPSPALLAYWAAHSDQVDRVFGEVLELAEAAEAAADRAPEDYRMRFIGVLLRMALSDLMFVTRDALDPSTRGIR